MKNSKKLEINPEKFIKNEELITLHGGEDPNPCGSGFATYTCTYKPYPDYPYTVTGTVCAAIGADPYFAILATYPQAEISGCFALGGGAPN